MTAKQTVQAHYPDATIRRAESAFSRDIEFRVAWDKDGKGNSKKVVGRNPSEAWVNAKNIIENLK